MTDNSNWLLKYQRDVYSQAGEDGIIEKILEVIPQHDKWCVEFGAWDGLFLTNTRYLIESKGFSAVLIEGDKEKFYSLQRNYSHRDNVITLNRYVQPPDPTINQGASLLSLVELGKAKGYELVSVLPFNAFFVRDEYYPLFSIESNSPEELRTFTDDIT